MLLYHICLYITVENIDDDKNENKEPPHKILTGCHTMPDFVKQ